MFNLTNSSLAILALTVAAASPCTAASVDLTKLPPASVKKGVTYKTDIQPLLESSCVRCHGGERPKAGLRLDSLENALKGSKDGKVLLLGNSKESLLVWAIAQLNDDIAMPPKFRPGRGRPGGPAGGPPSGVDHQRPSRPPGGGEAGPGGGMGFGPPPKPLTTEQVGLVRAWIDEGAK